MNIPSLALLAAWRTPLNPTDSPSSRVGQASRPSRSGASPERPHPQTLRSPRVFHPFSLLLAAALSAATLTAAAPGPAKAPVPSGYQLSQRPEEISEVGTRTRHIVRTPEGPAFSMIYPHGWSGRFDTAQGALQLRNPDVEGALYLRIGKTAASGARGPALARERFAERYPAGAIQETFEAHSMDASGPAAHGSVPFPANLRYTARVATFDYDTHTLEVAVQSDAPQFERARLAWTSLLNSLRREPPAR